MFFGYPGTFFSRVSCRYYGDLGYRLFRGCGPIMIGHQACSYRV
jgi:hypothetical protein